MRILDKTFLISTTLLVTLILIIAYNIVYFASSEKHEARACVNANGIYMEVYGGYECISKESLKTVELK